MLNTWHGACVSVVSNHKMNLMNAKIPMLY